MQLQQFRDYIRVQLDMDAEELPDVLLDAWLDEAFTRTISQEVRWPFYETRWDVAQVIGTTAISLPADCDPVGIMALQDATTGARLVQLANELAEDKFTGEGATASNPLYYSIYGRQIVLWPTLIEGETDRPYRLRGYRYSKNWMIDGASAEPDCDPRLHMLLAYYAIALAYAQQEDEVLEDTYMRRWQALYLSAHNAICSPRHHRPLVLNVGVPYTPSYNPVVWGPPVGP